LILEFIVAIEKLPVIFEELAKILTLLRSNTAPEV
jgi:hypothetical protein